MDWYHWLAARGHGEADDKRPAWKIVGGSLKERTAGELAAGTGGRGNPLASAWAGEVHLCMCSGNGQCSCLLVSREHPINTRH